MISADLANLKDKIEIFIISVGRTHNRYIILYVLINPPVIIRDTILQQYK